jgi:hypothetical protein
MDGGKWDEMKVAAAVGRLLLGAAGGFLLWIVASFVGMDARLWGMDAALRNADRFFRVQVVAGFVVAGAIAGMLAGERFFDWLANPSQWQ